MSRHSSVTMHATSASLQPSAACNVELLLGVRTSEMNGCVGLIAIRSQFVTCTAGSTVLDEIDGGGPPLRPATFFDNLEEVHLLFWETRKKGQSVRMGHDDDEDDDDDTDSGASHAHRARSACWVHWERHAVHADARTTASWSVILWGCRFLEWRGVYCSVSCGWASVAEKGVSFEDSQQGRVVAHALFLTSPVVDIELVSVASPSPHTDVDREMRRERD